MAAVDSTFSDVLNYIVDVFLGLSMFGCLAVVATFMSFRRMRTQPIKLVVYLCICIFFAQLFFFLSFYLYDTIMCIPCAMIFHYFFLADFLWTFGVAFNFYQMIVRRNRDAESLEIIYHISAWVFPLVVVVAMAASGNYYNKGGYCYMGSGIPIFLGFFLPGLFIVTANTVIFIFTVKEIHDTLKSAPNSDEKEKSKELKIYFSIFASIGLSWLFGFMMIFIEDNNTLALICLVLFSFLTPLQGFFIFVSYCCNSRVVNRWGQVFGYERLLDITATSTTASTRGGSHTTHTLSAHSATRKPNSQLSSHSAQRSGSDVEASPVYSDSELSDLASHSSVGPK